MNSQAKFAIGQTIHHRLFDYRGVIYDADPVFLGTQEWYEHVARSRPPKDEPWYHVLVHGSDSETYVAQQNLEADPSGEPILHPLTSHFFSKFQEGAYVPKRQVS